MGRTFPLDRQTIYSLNVKHLDDSYRTSPLLYAKSSALKAEHSACHGRQFRHDRQKILTSHTKIFACGGKNLYVDRVIGLPKEADRSTYHGRPACVSRAGASHQLLGGQLFGVGKQRLKFEDEELGKLISRPFKARSFACALRLVIYGKGDGVRFDADQCVRMGSLFRLLHKRETLNNEALVCL